MEQLGRHHPLLRRLRALRRNPELRARERVFLAEGLHLADEALKAAAAVEQVVTSSRLASDAEGRGLLDRLAASGWPCVEVADAVLNGLQDARSPQPVLLVVTRTDAPLEHCLPRDAETPLVVAVHGVQDPGNLGSVLRSADAAGADAFVVSGSAADPYHPRAVRASMGSVFRLPPVVAATELVLPWLERCGITSVGTAPDAECSLLDSELRGPLALWFGGEGSGLPQELQRRLARTLRIPLRRQVESLSVGAAAAVVLFEAARQRG